MFSRWMTTLGWIGLGCAIAYFIVMDKSHAPASGSDYVHNTQTALLVSAGMVIGGHLLRMLGGMLGVGMGRCKKCGKRIAKSEMFCFNHQKEIIWESREKTRTAGLKR